MGAWIRGPKAARFEGESSVFRGNEMSGVRDSRAGGALGLGMGLSKGPSGAARRGGESRARGQGPRGCSKQAPRGSCGMHATGAA